LCAAQQMAVAGLSFATIAVTAANVTAWK